MALQYIQATNTGEGFITHSDQETDNMTFLGNPANIWTVNGTTAMVNAWKARTTGTSMTKVAAQAAIDASLVGVLDDQGVQVTYTLV